MTNSELKLPEIDGVDLENAKDEGDAWNFLYLITDKYFEIIDENQENMKNFTASQHTLLAYNYLYGEICNGGFIQLIQNGYGGYIFDTPFSDNLREWGVEKIAEIVDEARSIYEKRKKELEHKTSPEEFSKLYEQIKDFEHLDDKFYEVTDSETEIVKNYVESNLEKFALIV